MITQIYNKKKVFFAMSGGVDSSVVAGVMKEAGHEVVGVTMRPGHSRSERSRTINHPDSKKPSCCGVDGIQDAQRAAQIIGIPHYVLDFAKEIDQYIIEDFTSEYLSGRTPNPCVEPGHSGSGLGHALPGQARPRETKTERKRRTGDEIEDTSYD
jgi:tRNA-specific 2-thiouridylase